MALPKPKWCILAALAGCLLACGPASAAAGEAVPGIPKTLLEKVKKARKAAEEAKKRRASEVKRSYAELKDRYKDVKNFPLPLDQVTQVGEKLVYRIKWQGVPAGELTLRTRRLLSVYGNRRAIIFEMHSQSNDFVSVFYPVDSIIKSYADVATGQSYMFRRNIKEGKRRFNTSQKFIYNYVTNSGKKQAVSIYSKTKKNQTSTKPPQPIPGPVQDPLSLVYYLRHFSFDEIGQQHRILVGGRKRTEIITVTAIKFEPLKLKLGTFDCVVVEPTGEKGVKRDNLCVATGTALVWLEKNTRIPLRISVKVPIGQVTATLIKATKTNLLEHRR